VVVRVRFANRRQLKQAFFREISRGGMFLRTDTPLGVRERVPIVLELPDGQAIDLVGEVVQTMAPDVATLQRPPGMAVRFLDFTPAKRVILEDFLASNRTNVPIPVDVPRPVQAGHPTPAMPIPAMENLVRALRRLVWLCGDARAFGESDYYQILGLSPTAGTDEIREACTVLRILLDPGAPPEGLADRLNAAQQARLAALSETVVEIERTLTHPARRAEYDATRFGIVR
jgi:Tfp pilus assembly protein PilZ